ncbi:MAG: hypothetical protein N2589_04365 [bacterium]|nr:hypothetical protein [bacterium]
MEKQKIIFIVALIVFIISWGWQLRPKKLIEKKVRETEIEERGVIGGVDIRKIEENFYNIRKKVEEFETGSALKEKKITLLKNPLKSWIIKKEEKIIEKPKEEIVVKPKETFEKPNFKISGIVYDKEQPYVIINNEVKKQGEEIGDFIIEKILEEKIILRDNDGNFFTLIFAYEKGE